MNFFVMGSVGDGIYYSDDSYQGWKSNFGFRITLNPSSSLRLSYNIDHDAFFTRRGGENVYRINLVSQRISYQISRPLSVRWITDWDDYYKGRAVAQAQILKLQQAGWGDLKEAQAENAKLKREIDSLIHDSD